MTMQNATGVVYAGRARVLARRVRPRSDLIGKMLSQSCSVRGRTDREDAIPPGYRCNVSLSLRDQQNLERLVSLLHHLKAFLVLLKRKLMGHDAFGRNTAIRDPLNHKRILIGAEVDPEYIQLFAVRDNAPIDGHIVREHAELDESAQLADHL